MAKQKPKKKKGWIQKAVNRMEQKGTVGSFSAAADKAGMSTSEYTDKVLMKGSKASKKMKKKAVFARNVAK